MSDVRSPDPGVAGRSARRESERKRERRLQKTASKSGFAKLITVLFGPSAKERRQVAEEKNWATGAEGEQMLAKSLGKRCPTVLMLNDRAMPGSRANIDHIAIAASGVYVIDAKRYHGKIKVLKPLFGAEKLTIKGRDRPHLIESLGKQVAVVEQVLSSIAPEVRVRGCFCFVAPAGFMGDSGLPVLRTLKIKGFPLYYPRRLAKRLNRRGTLTPDQARVIQAHLAASVPPA